MFIKLRKRSQLTLPKSIMKSFRLKEGDVFDCLTYEGKILLIPQNKKKLNSEKPINTLASSTFLNVPDRGFYIQCFSHFCMYLNKIPVPLNKKESELLAFLISEYGGPMHKDTVGALLWPDSSKEQRIDNLLRLCKRIQKIPGKIPLSYDKKTVWFDISQITCDLYEFEKFYKNKENPKSCESALSLYRGMLFYEDCYDWADQKEAYYDMRYLTLLSCMEDHMRQAGKEGLADVYKYYGLISE